MTTKHSRRIYKKATKAPKSGVKAPSVAASGLAGLRQAVAHAKGEHVRGLVVRKVVDVKAVRERTGLSQPKFAEEFGLDVSAVRDWEQNRRLPERTAQILLRLIDEAPEIVKKVAKAR